MPKKKSKELVYMSEFPTTRARARIQQPMRLRTPRTPPALEPSPQVNDPSLHGAVNRVAEMNHPEGCNSGMEPPSHLEVAEFIEECSQANSGGDAMRDNNFRSLDQDRNMDPDERRYFTIATQTIESSFYGPLEASAIHTFKPIPDTLSSYEHNAFLEKNGTQRVTSRASQRSASGGFLLRNNPTSTDERFNRDAQRSQPSQPPVGSILSSHVRNAFEEMNVTQGITSQASLKTNGLLLRNSPTSADDKFNREAKRNKPDQPPVGTSFANASPCSTTIPITSSMVREALSMTAARLERDQSLMHRGLQPLPDVRFLKPHNEKRPDPQTERRPDPQTEKRPDPQTERRPDPQTGRRLTWSSHMRGPRPPPPPLVQSPRRDGAVLRPRHEHLPTCPRHPQSGPPRREENGRDGQGSAFRCNIL